MPTLKLVAEDQIRRINLLVQEVKTLENLSLEMLVQKPDANSWCLLEILEHMNIAYEIYRPRVEKILQELPDRPSEQSTFNAHIFPRFFISMIKPKGTERKWKLKTMQRFEPQQDRAVVDPEAITRMFERFYDNKAHLKQAILDSRYKKVGHKRIVSAIGPVVKFYLPEAYEFIISHAERHLLQMKEVLALVGAHQGATR